MELMRGLLLGDADIKEGTNGSIFRLRMTNKRFLEWVSTKLSPLSRGVFLSESSSQQKESALSANLKGTSEESEFSDLYGLRTVTHPQINELADWYDTGHKRYPDNLTTEMLRMWYVTDGWNHNNKVRIRCKQQSDKFDQVSNMFDKLGMDIYTDESKGTIRLSSSSSSKFFDFTEAPPGFEYKWPK
jgi:hypothetical protein